MKSCQCYRSSNILICPLLSTPHCRHPRPPSLVCCWGHPGVGASQFLPSRRTSSTRQRGPFSTYTKSCPSATLLRRPQLHTPQSVPDPTTRARRPLLLPSALPPRRRSLPRRRSGRGFVTKLSPRLCPLRHLVPPSRFLPPFDSLLEPMAQRAQGPGAGSPCPGSSACGASAVRRPHYAAETSRGETESVPSVLDSRRPPREGWMNEGGGAPSIDSEKQTGDSWRGRALPLSHRQPRRPCPSGPAPPAASRVRLGRPSPRNPSPRLPEAGPQHRPSARAPTPRGRKRFRVAFPPPFPEPYFRGY